ncbi:MAG: GH25 family lysozyme [Acutalibacter sp.]
MQTKGVDISEHNGAVDFAALTQAGVKFAILRLGYGSDYTSQDDAQFAQNVRKAEAAGMPWGAYLYSYAKDASMAQSEARHALRCCRAASPCTAYGTTWRTARLPVRTWWPPARPSAPRWRLPGCTRAFTPPSAG